MAAARSYLGLRHFPGILRSRGARAVLAASGANQLRVANGDSGRPASSRSEGLRVEHVFRKTGPSFITLTSGTAGTAIYVDGVVAKRAPQIWLTTRAFAGRLV